MASEVDSILNQIRERKALLEKQSFVPPPPPNQPQDPNAGGAQPAPSQGAPPGDPSQQTGGVAQDPSQTGVPPGMPADPAGAGAPMMDPTMGQGGAAPGPQMEQGQPAPGGPQPDPAAGPGQYALINLDDLRQLFMEVASQAGGSGGKGSKPKKPSVDERLQNIEASLQQLGLGNSSQPSDSPGQQGGSAPEAPAGDSAPGVSGPMPGAPVMSAGTTGAGEKSEEKKSSATEGDLPIGLSRLRSRRRSVSV